MGNIRTKCVTMKISCTPVSCLRMFRNGTDQEAYFAMIAEAGAEGSDLLSPESYPWFWRDFEAEKKTVLRRLRDHGLALSGYATANNFAHDDPAAVQANVDKVLAAIRTAAELEAPCVRIFGGYHCGCGGGEGMERAHGLELVRQGLEKVLPAAEKQGVVLALENHGRLPGLSAEIEALCRYFDSPSLRVLFDCANFMAFNMDEIENPLTAYEKLKPWIVHCHVKSWQPEPVGSPRRVEGCIAGEGAVVPLQQFFYLLEENNYRGFCSLEYDGGKSSPETEGVPKSLRNLREMKLAAETVAALKRGAKHTN